MAWMVLVAVVALPVVEITLFIKSAQWLGLLPTILAAFAAGIIGIALIRAQGFQLLLRTRAQLDRGEVPVREVFDAVCLAAAGVLLVLPGFFSDFLAILLLLPPVRAALRLWLVGRLARAGLAEGARPSTPPVIDADYHVIDDPK
jgi:UPF0716 protein FxsA